MNDSEFKSLPHHVCQLVLASSGSQVAVGYKPDLTIREASGRLRYIVEFEQKTDRKAFLGALIKAEKFAEDTKESPILLFVMKLQDNATVSQIANHLEPYASWLAKKTNGGLSLAEVWIISVDQYLDSIEAEESLDSDSFRARTRRLQW